MCRKWRLGLKKRGLSKLLGELSPPTPLHPLQFVMVVSGGGGR